MISLKEKAKPTLFSSTPPPEKRYSLNSTTLPHPPKNFILCAFVSFSNSVCMHWWRWYYLESRSVQGSFICRKCYLTVWWVVLLQRYHKASFWNDSFYVLKLSEPVTPVPTGDDVKPPIQQRIQSTQREGGKFHLWMHKTWLIERCFNPPSRKFGVLFWNVKGTKFCF